MCVCIGTSPHAEVSCFCRLHSPAVQTLGAFSYMGRGVFYRCANEHGLIRAEFTITVALCPQAMLIFPLLNARKAMSTKKELWGKNAAILFKCNIAILNHEKYVLCGIA